MTEQEQAEAGIRPGLVRLHLWLVPVVAACWYLAGLAWPGVLPAVEPFYPGCLASALIWVVGWVMGGKPA